MTTNQTDLGVDALVEAMAARMKLAVVNTGMWRATRQHKRETVAENQRHNTDAAKVLVRVSDHKALSDLSKLHAAVYQEHRRITLASAQEGMRLLPAGREFQHAERMRELADKHNALVAEFLADYDAEKAAAPARLNGLYDASMWPSHDEVAKRFKFQTRYLSCPTDGEWGALVAESAQAAQAELRERITSALERVRDRCKKTDGKLFATVFDSIRELRDLVPDLDVTGEFAPIVEAMAPLAEVHSDNITGDEKARKQVARKATNILTMLGGVK